MKAEIISIGTELLMGELTDTNGPFLASRLPPLGIQLQGLSQVGDDLEMLAGTISRGLARSDVIFTSGGLGPTQDDLTREAIAKALGEKMEVRPELLKPLQESFQRRGVEMPSHNIKQATLIPSATVLLNGEMTGMWEDQVVPRLEQEARGEVIVTRNIKINGLSEAAVDETVSQWLSKENPYLGVYAKTDGIHLRIIARAPDEEAARDLIRPVEEGLVRAVGPYIWEFDEESPEQSVGQLLSERGQTLASMESCTGGLLASSLTDGPDSSTYFKGGLVTVSNEALIAAGVSAELIEQHGSVSEEVASAMATTAREGLGADFGVSTTGVVGPDELDGKPVGLVYIGLADSHSVRVQTHRLPPRRAVIKRRGVSTALIELAKLVKGV